MPFNLKRTTKATENPLRKQVLRLLYSSTLEEDLHDTELDKRLERSGKYWMECEFTETISEGTESEIQWMRQLSDWYSSLGISCTIRNHKLYISLA